MNDARIKLFLNAVKTYKYGDASNISIYLAVGGGFTFSITPMWISSVRPALHRSYHRPLDP